MHLRQIQRLSTFVPSLDLVMLSPREGDRRNSCGLDYIWGLAQGFNGS
jgi:hypothetical protein